MAALLASGVLLLAAPKAAATPQASPSPTPAAVSIPFDTAYLVILRKGPRWSGGETPADMELQTQHLGYLTRMMESGKMVAAGPFDEQDDAGARGLAIYKTATKEEAKTLASGDPAVKAGHLTVEVMLWYSPKGQVEYHKVEMPKAH